MTENKAVTYSLLAHIRNSGTLMKGPVDVFVPLIKRTLHQLNNKGVFKGESMIEIQTEANSMYSIDFPIPVLKIILFQISTEINSLHEKSFIIHQDGSYIIHGFHFEDFEESVQESRRDAESLEKIFVDFCNLNNIEVTDKTSIFNFIDKNKVSISKYLSNYQHPNGHDFTIEAQFVDYFKKVPKVFDIVRRIYLGSIISSFLEYKTENFKQEIELLFDTNFIVSLIDLNTPESTQTCEKLIELGKNLGFKFTILSDTVEETKALLRRKAENFTDSFLVKRINQEDIFNACERRNFSASDLERIIDNLEEKIKLYGISINIYTEALKVKAKDSIEYENFKKIRTSHYSAMHDTIAILYVKEKRKKKIREFEKVNCWFVNNTTSHDSEGYKDFDKSNSEYQKESIRVDELLNILWLSNPRLNSNQENDELIDIGLSSIVAYTLNDTLPKASIIKELDLNIQKYRGDQITDKDILNISTRISNKQLKNINELNEFASKNSEEFVRKLKEEAQLQEKEERERIEKFENLYKQFEKEISSLDRAKSVVKNKENNLHEKELELETVKSETEKEKLKIQHKLESLNKALEEEKLQKQNLLATIISEKKEKYISQEVYTWRKRSWIQSIVSVITLIIFAFYLFYQADWNIEEAIKKYKENIYVTSVIALILFIMTFWVLRNLREKYLNHSNIKSYKDSIKIPNDIEKIS